jgi:hypothetical protein
MNTYTKEYSIDWNEECEAESFEEAEKILDKKANEKSSQTGLEIYHGEIEVQEND